MAERDVHILDCTIRDGNYAVNFQFTENDTRLLTGELARLGVEWIEVGHGLGLGGSEAGKGDMPASDAELIRAARSAAGDAKVGMFCIPGIASLDHLEMAADAGLDFVRIGYDAPESEETHPFVERARALGMVPWVNLMKSYGVTPAEFGERAAAAADAGAEVVACVDSAGGMMPEDVARYFDAARERVTCGLGFHGHNNLMMVVANCLTAYEHGVRHLDTTLCGLGRSAGNAPTEILVAVLDRLGIRTGIDLFGLMDTIDLYLWPLVEHVRAHDMMGVTAGYAQFHSSFLPRVARVARQHGVELRRLVAEVGRHDPVRLDEAHLEASADRMAGTATGPASEALRSFQQPRLSGGRIATSMAAVRELLDGLETAAAKRPGSTSVLHLVPSGEPSDALLMPEFAFADADMVMGRVTYGGLDTLERLVELAAPRAGLILVSANGGWAGEAPERVARLAGAARTVPVRDVALRRELVGEALHAAALRYGRDALLLYGTEPALLDALDAAAFDQVFFYGTDLPGPLARRGVIPLLGGDWQELNVRFDAVVFVAEPDPDDVRLLSRVLARDGRAISLLPGPSAALREALGDRLVRLDMNAAYAGVVSRHRAVEQSFNVTEQHG